ncbi:hypothetical protein BC332_28122 [Capsicum chinense]|nr:hypothetical protein BC332_28122 [Capsicum chinense]
MIKPGESEGNIDTTIMPDESGGNIDTTMMLGESGGNIDTMIMFEEFGENIDFMMMPGESRGNVDVMMMLGESERGSMLDVFTKVTHCVSSRLRYRLTYGQNHSSNNGSSTISEAHGVHLLQNQLVLFDNKEADASNRPCRKFG